MEQVVDSTNHQAQVQHLHYLPNVNVSLSLPDLLLECVLAVQIARRYVREDLLGITDDDLRRIIQEAEAAECDGEKDSLVLSSDATTARRGTNDDNANNNQHITGKEDVSLSREKEEEKKDFTKNGRASEAIKKLISSRLGIQTKGALAHKKEKEEAFDMVTTADKIAQEVIQRILIVRFSEQAVAEDEMWATSESKTAITTTTTVSSAAGENVTAEKTIGHFPRLVEIAKRVCYDFEAGRRLPTPPSVRAKWVQQQQQQQHFQRHEQQGGSAPPSSSVTKADNNNNVNGDDKTQKTKQEFCDAAVVSFSLLDLLPFTLIGEEETSRFVAVDDGSIISFSPSEFKAKHLLHQEGLPDRAARKEDKKDNENPKTGGSLDEQVQCALSKCVNIYLPETLGTISCLSQTRCGTEGIFSVLCGAADKSSDTASLALEELIPHFAKFRKFIEEKFYHLNPQTASSEPRAPLNYPLIIKACHKAEYKEDTENPSSSNIDNESDNKNSRFGLINSKIRNSKATDEPFKLFPPSFSPSTSSSSSQGVVDTANENNQGAAANNISPSSFGMFMSLLDLSNGCSSKTASTIASQEESRDDVTTLYAPTRQIADDVSLGDVFLSESDSASLIPPCAFPLRIIERQALIRYLTVHQARKGGQKGEDACNKEHYLSSQVFDVERFDSLCEFDTSISFSAMLMSSSAQEAEAAAAPPPRFMVLPLLVGTPDEIKKCDGGDDVHFPSSSSSSYTSLLHRSLKAFDQLLDAFEKKDLSVLTQRHRSLVAETFMATRFVNLYTTLVLPEEELEHTSQSRGGKGAKETRMSSMHCQSVYDKLDAVLTAYVVHRQRQFLRSLLRQRVCVIIDPIDGTNAFTQGDRHAPMTLVGVAVDGEPVIGVTNRILSEKNSVAAAAVAGDKEEDALHVEGVHEAVAVKGKVDGTTDMEAAVRPHLPIVGSSTAELLGAIAKEYRREINTFIGDHHHAAEPSVLLSSSKVDEFMELIVPTFPETVDGHRAEGGELELVTQKQTSQDGEGKKEDDKKVSSLLTSFNQEGGRKGYGTPAAWPFAHYFRDHNENANISINSNSRNNSTTITLSSKAKLMGQMIESVRIPREPLSYCLTWPSTSSSSCVSSLSHCVIDGEWIDVEARQQLALRQCMTLLPFLLAEDEEASESAESGGNGEKTRENENTSHIVPSKIKLSDLHLVASVSSTTSAKALHTVSTIVSPFAPLPDRGAGNKLLAVAKGLSDTMVAPPNTIHKWDTLAPHAFLRSVGGDIVEAREGVSVVYPATHAAANAIFEAKREAIISNICVVQFPCDAAELTSLPSGVVACQSAFIRSIVLRRIQNEKRHAFQQWLEGQKEDEKPL